MSDKDEPLYICTDGQQSYCYSTARGLKEIPFSESTSLQRRFPNIPVLEFYSWDDLKSSHRAAYSYWVAFGSIKDIDYEEPKNWFWTKGEN